MEKKHIPVPDPLPAPLPNGGPELGYQWHFNERYYETRAAALQPFSYGLAAGQNPDVNPLSEIQLTLLADQLYDQLAPNQAAFGPNHVDFDQEIDYWQWDPYEVMFQRSQVYGYQRVPIGTGNTSQPPSVVNPSDLQGPPIPGKYLLVTCNINEL